MSRKLRVRLILCLLLLWVLVVSFACSLVLSPKQSKTFSLAEEKLAITSLADAGDLDQALSRVLQALEMSPDQNDFHALMAGLLLQKGSAEFDERAFSERVKPIAYLLIARHPDSAAGYHLLGYANEIVENYREAIQSYNLAIAVSPDSSYLYSTRGHAFDLAGQLEDAVRDHGRALELNPNDIGGSLNLARIELRRGNLAQSGLLASDAYRNSSNVFFKGEALLVQGYSALQQGHISEALDFMLKAQKLTPESPSVLVGVAQARFAQLASSADGVEFANETNNILQIAQRATKINPNHTLGFLVAARTLRLIRNEEASRRLYEMAELACPHDITLGLREKEKLCIGISEEKNLSFTS